MARRQRGGGTSAGGPLGNAARDLKDDFVGVPAETIKTGPPPRWPPKPKRVKSNTFHSKVTGNTSPGRADRAPHYRRGGWVSGYAKGGALEQVSKETSKGGLHRSLGVPEGQKIGAARIAKATHSSNPKIRREANLAETYAKYRKADGGEVPALKAGGHITTAQRKALPSSDFALPGKGTGAGGKGPGSYPIDTPNRARNALARGAQHASPAELATIKRKVHAKYPGIK